jgi:hypothetical protein
MPAHFNKLGIRFTYPDNWKLDESEVIEGEPTVTLYAPEGSFWTISLHPLDADPGVLVKAAVAALRDTYTDLDYEPVREAIAGQELVGADVNFYCLDLTNTALVRSYVGPRHVGLILCQAEDRDYAQVEPVFRAMMHNLLANIDDAGEAADEADDEAIIDVEPIDDLGGDDENEAGTPRLPPR